MSLRDTDSSNFRKVLGFGSRLGGVSQRQNLFLDRFREIYERKLAFVVQIVLAAFIDDSHKFIFCRACVRKQTIDLSYNQGCFIIPVVQAQCKTLSTPFHQKST